MGRTMPGMRWPASSSPHLPPKESKNRKRKKCDCSSRLQFSQSFSPTVSRLSIAEKTTLNPLIVQSRTPAPNVRLTSLEDRAVVSTIRTILFAPLAIGACRGLGGNTRYARRLGFGNIFRIGGSASERILLRDDFGRFYD